MVFLWFRFRRDSAAQRKRVIRKSVNILSFARSGDVLRWSVFPHSGHVFPGCGAIRRCIGIVIFRKRRCFSLEFNTPESCDLEYVLVVFGESDGKCRMRVVKKRQCFSSARSSDVIRCTVFSHLGHVFPGCGEILTRSENTLLKKRRLFSFARSGDVFGWSAFSHLGQVFPWFGGS